MISLLFFGLWSAGAASPGMLRGALDPGPSAEQLIHRNTGKALILGAFAARAPLVCDLLLRGESTAAAYGRESRGALVVDLDLPAWVRTQLGSVKIALFPHADRVDTVDTWLEAPFDQRPFGDVAFAGPVAARFDTLFAIAREIEGRAARGPRTFAAHGKMRDSGEFDLEGASLLVKNLFTDRTPFLTLLRGRVLGAGDSLKLFTRSGRSVTLVPGPELGNLALPGDPANPAELRPFDVVTVLGLQFGAELRLLRILDRPND